MTFEQQRTYFQNRIRDLKSPDLAALALEIFSFQAKYNVLYAEFLDLLNIDPRTVKAIEQIPFLPISLFKNKTIKTGEWETVATFESSGTTQSAVSRHEVRSPDWYTSNTVRGFETFYGHPKDFCILALLPSYLERSGSSLVLMADHFIQLSDHPESGFFLNNHDQLFEILQKLKTRAVPTILLGVSFGLLDFIENHQIVFPDLIVMETGGMKGRRKEITRAALHESLKQGFGLETIHSEYGMTELFSQAYSKGDGMFLATPSMKILIRDISDPFHILDKNRHGAINIIDLANLDTCAFIATDDLGRQREDESFEILGRLDASDIRGCNLMVGEY